ncbi:hypothetical protein BAC1_01346 [uncultured bacterium]|nr:hypothetical protein BAC1_01346 [uncultured bacterium]
MEYFVPNSFIETLAGLIICLALVLGFVSLIPVLRSHAIRLLALFVVAALSLFSNHWSTYFAGIFIIATAVTELEFLQNLAAIIRGNKDYFDYKKETLSIEQQQKKIEKEQELISQQGIEGVDEAAAGPPTIKSYRATISAVHPNIDKLMTVEEKALDKMEEYYKAKIERGVRISRKGKHIELDGIIPSVVDDMVSEKIIEVKYLRSPNNFATIRNIFPKMEDLARAYSEITNKIAKIHIVLVVEGEEELNEKQLSILKQLIDLSNVAMGYSVFTTKQLGIQ